MANFNLEIDEAGFERVGIKPGFNEGLYGELLDEFAPDADDLRVVRLFPGVVWWRRPLTAARLIFNGLYDDKQKQIDVFCTESLEETNTALLHETKHFIDDTTGELKEGHNGMMRRVRREVAGIMAAGLGISAVTAATHPREALVTGLYSAYLSIRQTNRAYVGSSHELAARQFADSAQIAEAYGRIISYQRAE